VHHLGGERGHGAAVEVVRVPRGPVLSGEEKAQIWAGLKRGETLDELACRLGRSFSGVRYVAYQRGYVAPRGGQHSGFRLSAAERDEIAVAVAAGDSLRSIAARLGRAPSTISREVRRNGGTAYRAVAAQAATERRARRPKPAKLAVNIRLRDAVAAMLKMRWSPEQIAQRLAVEFPDDAEMRVSAETIYQSLFIQGRGALRKELASCLRTGRATRRPRARSHGPGPIPDLVSISERPAEVEDRAVPGHWEGDLIMGASQRSAVATLVERSTRYTLLCALPAGHSAPAVRDALAAKIGDLPASLRRTLTWDRGGEMAQHVNFSVDTGVQVYFCDPHSPWQRGTNENTNGLLRQYLPKSSDLSRYDQTQLDAIADELNGRPRKTLNWLNPAERLAQLLQ